MSAAVIGMGKANDGFDEVRVPPGGCIDVADEGGRMGCVAGEALADGGLDVAVAELWPGETPDVAVCGGATYVVAGLIVPMGAAGVFTGGAGGGFRCCGCC